MKVIVTGGAGFIGSHLVDAYIEDGDDVVVLDDLSRGKEENLNSKARFYKVDISKPEISRIFKAERPDIVNHHAAEVDVRRSVKEPLFDATVNILGTLNLLNIANKFGITHFLFSSSGGAVYGNPHTLPCNEQHPIQPLSHYGVSKFSAEQYIVQYHRQYGLNYTIFRYANVYGPRQDPNGEAGVVAIFAGSMLNGRQPIIFGSGEQQRDFVFVSDIIRANLLAQKLGYIGTLNIGSSKGTSINNIYHELEEITQFRKERVYAKAKPAEVFISILDVSKAEREIGWKSKITLQEGLLKTVDHISRGMKTV